MPLIDADRLAGWGRTKDGENRLPELLTRLVSVTAARRLRVGDFRSGRGMQMGGYDGVTDVEGDHEYLPEGAAVWEFGTGERPGKKAQDDYTERSKRPGKVDPKETTYVAVCSRRWGGRADWEADRNAEGVWKEVRAFDGDTLYNWLVQAHPVHLWLSEVLGTQPDGAVTPEEWWTDYRYTGTAALEPQDVTQGRKQERDLLLSLLAGAPRAIPIHGKDVQEAIAFAVAVALQAEDSDHLLPRITILEDRKAWRLTARCGFPLILIPEFPPGDLIHAAVGRNHMVLVPAGDGEERTPGAINLPPLPPGIVASRLEAAGASPSQAGRETPAAAESITDLRLAMEAVRNPDGPEWARPENARQLTPFLLAGQWEDTRAADRLALEQLSGRTYRDLNDLLVRWRLSPRPPVSKMGAAWVMVSRPEAWDWLHKALVEDDLTNFRRTCLEVLRELDPKYDLEPDQRWMAGAMGKQTSYSPKLREGLADGLAMMGATSDDHPIDGALLAEDVACVTVRDLLDGADWTLWASLSPLLSLLAEACPDQFLAAAERDLVGGTSPLGQLFTDQGGPMTATGSPHSELLFALERLGRSAEYLGRVVLVLARLAELDPGGVLSNRPNASLVHLLRLALPQTAATSDQRFAILDLLRQRFPDVAWTTMLAMLPGPGTIVIPTPSPRWRKWPLESDT